MCIRDRLYSNYSLILSGIVAIVAKVTEAAAASVGNLGVLENEKKVFSVYCTMNLVNFWIYSFCTICFLMLFQPFIKMWLGEMCIRDRVYDVIGIFFLGKRYSRSQYWL